MPYLTPDSPPEDNVCLQMLIPNDVAWIGIVKGAFSELLKSYNFELFGDFSPEETAQKFIDIYDAWVFSECSMSGCCYDVVESRVTSDGLLQIRVNGGDWQQNPADPRVSAISLPPPVIDETHTKCDAATNGNQHLSDYISAYSEALGASASIVVLAGEIAALIVAVLIAPEAIPLILPLIFAAASAAFSLGQTAWDAYFTSDVHDVILCALYCNIGEDGQFTDDQFNLMVLDLQANMPSGVAKDTFVNSVIAMGAKGINNMCSYGESSEGDCSGCTCCSILENWHLGKVWDGSAYTGTGGVVIETGNCYAIIESQDRGDGEQAVYCTASDDSSFCADVGVTVTVGTQNSDTVGVGCGTSRIYTNLSTLAGPITNQNAFGLISTVSFTVRLDFAPHI